MQVTSVRMDLDHIMLSESQERETHTHRKLLYVREIKKHNWNNKYSKATKTEGGLEAKTGERSRH